MPSRCDVPGMSRRSPWGITRISWRDYVSWLAKKCLEILEKCRCWLDEGGSMGLFTLALYHTLAWLSPIAWAHTQPIWARVGFSLSHLPSPRCSLSFSHMHPHNIEKHSCRARWCSNFSACCGLNADLWNAILSHICPFLNKVIFTYPAVVEGTFLARAQLPITLHVHHAHVQLNSNWDHLCKGVRPRFS